MKKKCSRLETRKIICAQKLFFFSVSNSLCLITSRLTRVRRYTGSSSECHMESLLRFSTGASALCVRHVTVAERASTSLKLCRQIPFGLVWDFMKV